MMKLKLAALAVGRLLYELGLFRAKSARNDKEQRNHAIKEDPNAVAAERFGDAAGRVHIDTKPD